MAQLKAARSMPIFEIDSEFGHSAPASTPPVGAAAQAFHVGLEKTKRTNDPLKTALLKSGAEIDMRLMAKFFIAAILALALRHAALAQGVAPRPRSRQHRHW